MLFLFHSIYSSFTIGIIHVDGDVVLSCQRYSHSSSSLLLLLLLLLMLLLLLLLLSLPLLLSLMSSSRLSLLLPSLPYCGRIEVVPVAVIVVNAVIPGIIILLSSLSLLLSSYSTCCRHPGCHRFSSSLSCQLRRWFGCSLQRFSFCSNPFV